MAERSLTEFAESVVRLETREPVETLADVRLGPSYAQLRDRNLFLPRDRTAGVNLYDLRDVTLHGWFMILLKDGRPVSETNYMMAPMEWEEVVRSPPRVTQRVGDDTRVVIGSNRNFRNYYHWIVQAAPAIDHALRAPSDRPLSLALRDGSERLHADTLRLLGFADVPLLRVEQYESYHLPHARYSDFLGGGTAFDVSRAARETFQRLAGAVRDVPTGHDAIYIARSDSKQRRVVNEAALIELLRAWGVSIVEGSAMTLAQQVNLFRNARTVIGAHGAGLTNLAFCRPGALVYEMVQDIYPNACFNVLAQACGLTYLSDLFPTVERTADIHESAWEVALDVVEERLREMPGLRRA